MKILRVVENQVMVTGEATSFDRLLVEDLLGTKDCGAATYQGAPVWARDDEKAYIHESQAQHRLTNYQRRCLARQDAERGVGALAYPYVVLSVRNADLHQAGCVLTGWRGPTRHNEAEATADALLHQAAHRG